MSKTGTLFVLLALLLQRVAFVRTQKVIAECDPDKGVCDWWIRPAAVNQTMETWVNRTVGPRIPTHPQEPYWDSRGSEGKYYLQITKTGTGGVASMTAKLTVKIESKTGQRYCLQFHYWMYGNSDPGPRAAPSLTVWVTEPIGIHKVWYDKWNRGRDWSFTEAEWVSSATEFNVTIDGRSAVEADVAIDNIRLVEGKCLGPVEETRKASLGEDTTIISNHVSYTVSLNFSSPSAGCEAICRMRHMNFSPLGHAIALFKNSEKYAPNCFDIAEKCKEEAPNGGCSGTRSKDWTVVAIGNNCSISCGFCDSKDFRYDTCGWNREMRCMQYSQWGRCTEHNPDWMLRNCPRTCDSCNFLGTANEIFTSSFWVEEDDTKTVFNAMSWEGLDGSWTGFCPAYNIHLGFIRQPCNALIPCLCEDYEVPVYTDVISEVSVNEKASDKNTSNTTCETIDGRQETRVINLDLKQEHHVESVMVTIEKDKATPLGYIGPLVEPPTSPIARNPYFSVAVGRPSYVSSFVPDDWVGPAPVANDGSRDNMHNANVPHCTYTATGVTKGVHWWYVDLQSQYKIHAVTVTRRFCCYDNDFTDFRIVVDNSSLVGKNMTTYFQKSAGLCHNGSFIPVKTPTLIFQCEQELIGRYVVIMKSQLGSTAISLVVCEMEIHGQLASLSPDALPGLSFCPDDTAHQIGGNCYKYIGRPASYVQQVVNCRRWDPPFSHIVPFEDLSQFARDALRVWLFNRFYLGEVWTKSYSQDGLNCTQLSVRLREYGIATVPCIRSFGALCRSTSRNVYPIPLISLPVPQPGPKLEVTYDKVTFPKAKVTEDSFLLLWEIALSAEMNTSTEIFIVVMKDTPKDVKSLTRFRLKPLLEPGLNFGGFHINKKDYLKLPKGSYVGLEATNLSDLVPIPSEPGSAATTTEAEYSDGDKNQSAVTVRVNFPFRIWVLPETLGRIPQRCIGQNIYDVHPLYHNSTGLLGDYQRTFFKSLNYYEEGVYYVEQYPCMDRCLQDDLCSLGYAHFYTPGKYLEALYLAGEQVIIGWNKSSGHDGWFSKQCSPYHVAEVYPVAETLKSSITVNAGSKNCTRVTSYLNGDGAILYHCNTKTANLRISVVKNEAKICKIRAFGERVTSPSANLIPKTSTRVRGNIWPPSGSRNCAPIGFSRARIQWLQVDLLVTYNGVTAKALYRESPGQPAISPKFHLYVTATSDWTDADPYYVGLIGKVDRVVSFPCSDCRSGRFVSLKEVGNAKGIELCQFNVYGDRGRERRLGMAGGYILDKQITASRHIPGKEPHRARLNGAGAWCTTVYDTVNKPYLQVSLTDTSVITAIETQSWNTHSVNEYTLKYGMSELNLKWYTDVVGRVKEFFRENIGKDSTVHRLVTPFQCKVIRIQVERFVNTACLRLELIGYHQVSFDAKYDITKPTSFTSPDSPNYYGNDRTITWTITPPVGKYIRLMNMTLNVAPNLASDMKIDNWKLQTETVCQDKYVLYREDSTPVITNAGYYVHDVSESMQLKLHACMVTAYRSGGYFEAQVDFVDCPGYGFNAKSCDTTFGPITTNCGYIGSPEFPAVYPDTKTCAWSIKTKPAHYISVDFVNFDIAGDDASCTGDKLSLIYVDNGQKKLLRDLCNGNWDHGQAVSDWNTLLLEYSRVRIPTEAGKGFIAKFTSIDPIKEQVFNYTEGHCMDGWLRFMSGCYKYVKNDNNVTLTWTKAEENCKTLAAGSHLASIQDDHQRDFILQSLFFQWPYNPESKDIYIGLTDQKHDGRFVWTDGLPLSYTNWDSGEPDGSVLEGCGMLRIASLNSRRYWQDIPCAMKMTSQYICKKPADAVTQYSITDLGGVIGIWNQSCDLNRQFKCDNGNCIQNFFVCNAHDDCGDGSDEIDCPSIKDVCPLSQFRCQNGDCILISKYCDHVTDCPGGEDEAGCVWVDCSPGEFRCTNGQCIKNTTSAKNFVKDCVDGSDEMLVGCPGFQCYSGACIPQKLHCDGVTDCMGIYKEDETGCETINTGLGKGYLKCSNNLPYNATQRCIYDKDIFNYSTACRDLSHLQGCDEFNCPVGHLKCPGHYCIPVRMVCDDVDDCPQGEDERNCNKYTCPGMFKCSNSKNCIPQSAVCDGIKNCWDGDDELSCSPCPAECECIGDAYQCSGKGLTSTPKIPNGAKAIDMSENMLPGLFDTFDFSFLEKLVLSRNNISTIANGVFSKLVNLLHLDLRFNQLQMLSSNLFRGLSRLQVLALTGNPGVSAIADNAFVVNEDGGVMPVTRMNLSNMAVKELYNMSLAGLEETLNLDLANNKLNTIATTAFANTAKLQTLNISGNDLSNFNGKEAFLSVPNLQHLKSDHFRFCCLAPQVAEESCFPQKDAFSSCTDLVRLDVLRIFLWLLGSVAVLGNILVLLLRILAREPLTANTSIIISLALSDFLMGVYLFIVAGADMAFRGFYIEVDEAWRTGPGCAIAGFLSVLSSEVSVFTLAIMSVDRFLVVVFPFSKHKINLRKAKILISLSWLVGAILAGIPLIPNDYFQGKFYSRSGVCLSLHLTSETTPGWEYSVAVNLGLNLLAFMIIAVTYGWMYLVIRRAAEMMKGKATRKKGENQEMAIARKMALIILTDFACWMPIIILGFAAMSGNVVIPGDVYAWIAVFVLPINSAANPVLYTLSSVDTIKKILFKKDLKAETSLNKTNMSYVDDEDDEDATVKLVNCYKDGTQLLPYVPDDPKMKTLSLALKEGADFLTLKDMVTALRYVGKAMVALHSTGLTAVSVNVDDVGLVFEEKLKPGCSRIHSAYLCSGVKQAGIERDLKGNIDEFGNLCKKLLRHYASHRKGT